MTTDSPGEDRALKAIIADAITWGVDPMAFEAHHEPCCKFDLASGQIRCQCECHGKYREPMLNSDDRPTERMARMREEESKRWEKVRELAASQRLVLVQVTSLRYTVVEINDSVGCSSIIGPSGALDYYTMQTGKVVYGPAKWEDCRRCIAARIEPVPEAIRP